MTRLMWLSAAAACAVVAADVRGAAASRPGEELLAAASREHLWFVLETAGGKAITLCHHAPAMGGPYYRPQMPLVRKPAAMAAWNDRLWLTFDPKPDAREPQRGTFSVRIKREAAMGMYVTVPEGKLEMSPGLPGGGALASLVATADGPVALLLPGARQPPGASPLAKRNDSRSSSSTSNAPSLDQPMLLALRGDEWVRLPLPDDFSASAGGLLGVEGPDAGHAGTGPIAAARLILLTPAPPGQIAPDRRAQSMLYEQLPDGSWAGGLVGLEFRQVRSLVNIDGHVAALLSDLAEGTVDVVYLRGPAEAGAWRPEGQNGAAPAAVHSASGALVPLARVPQPSTRWTAVGLDGELRILEHGAGAAVTMRAIDALSGQTGIPQALVTVSIPAGRVWHLSLMLMLAIAAVVLVFMVKPAPAGSLTLAPGLMILPATARLLALALDLFPSGVVTVLALGCSPRDLLSMPLMTFDVERLWPYVLMTALTALHAGLSEALWGRSLGKMLVDARVITVEGAAPSLGRMLVRAAVKWMVLLAPPLAVFAALNTHWQGLDDMAAGTVVVREAQAPSVPPQSGDR